MNVYASWIRDYMTGKDRVFRVQPSPVDLGIPTINLREFRYHLEQSVRTNESGTYGYRLKPIERAFPEDPARHVEERWKQLLEQHAPANRLSAELRQLLGTRNLT
jgi:hypothetical protein